MGVGDCRHCVDFEVFVRSNTRSLFNWSPVSPGWLSIVEPLISKLLDVIGIYVGNSGSNLTSWKSSTLLHHVLTDFMINRCWGFSFEKLIVHSISSSDNFNIIEIMSPNSWKTCAAIVHLSSENFVSEEIVAEKTTVRVGKIVRVSSGDVWQVSKKGMHRVVLFMDIIEVLSMLINSVVSEHVFHQRKSIEVFILGTWSIIKDTNV